MHLEFENSLDVAVLEAVLETGDIEARMTLARQVCGLIAAEDTPAGERTIVLPVLLKLAVDEARAVRQVMAEELASVPHIHADLLFSMVAAEDDVALPFLRVTPSLNAWHMMAILRVGDEPRKITVAGRPDITAEAAAAIVNSGTLAVVLALLDNESVQLESHDLQIIYGRLGQSGELADRLLAMSDLPLDIRITQAKRTALRMRQLMAERAWLPSNDASELVADAEDVAVLDVLLRAKPDDLLKGITFLATKNLLTPALIVRAACLGETRIVEAALSHLSGIHPQRLVNTIYSRGGQGMKSVVNRSGLPSVCLGLLVGFAEVVVDTREEGVNIGRESFGRRLLEALMTRYDMLNGNDRAKAIDYIGRFAEDRVRKIARQLKVDIQRAA
jgi:uncharacterized protein (DUF2336 family)